MDERYPYTLENLRQNTKYWNFADWSMAVIFSFVVAAIMAWQVFYWKILVKTFDRYVTAKPDENP